MAPRGNLNSFECTFNLKISYEQLFCVIYILVLLVCFLRLILHLVFVFICFGESIRWLKIAGVSRFTFHVSRFTFHVSYRIWDIFGILWGLPVKLKVSLVGRCASCVGMKVRSKLTLHRVTRHLFSHTLFWINILSSSVLFRSTSFVFRLSFFVFRQRRRRRT
jgi:hypothetical protein